MHFPFTSLALLMLHVSPCFLFAAKHPGHRSYIMSMEKMTDVNVFSLPFAESQFMDMLEEK